MIGRSERMCSAACLELMHAEMVSYFLSARETRESAQKEMERLGFRVGQKLAERYTKDYGRITEPMEVLRFIFSDFWPVVFSKPPDSLTTNNNSLYYIEDTDFRWTSKISVTSRTTLEDASYFLTFPCGIVKGAFAALDVDADVKADFQETPSRCLFTIIFKGKAIPTR
ncbi:putative transport protein particle component [Paratrimastix pyriformis]|uniref:Transport protein particle component n=1 Tax=Paratrimastix pyriformis TaxID=342808 RepID=A0ABQ8UFI8_9EUKA|nr:putative transport protein particle component [Paratrimastix pyriformis]